MNRSEFPSRSPTVDTEVTPSGTLEVLSQREVEQLRNTRDSRILELFRRCALAVLNTGDESDDALALFDEYHNFSVEIVQRTRGLKLKIKNAPASAFVDGRMVEGIRQHLFAVLRDLVYIGTEIENNRRFDLNSSEGITDAVFHILEQARVLVPDVRPNVVVCWGGHSISRVEYDYTKEVGYHLGLRGLDICTGCGPGAMKGPMKGAAIGHVKQRTANPRYIGLTEPGIIAAEPPNPMVNHLVVLPDIEKRLEAFVRMGHGIVIFPGGVGTVEEVLYLLGLLMDPANADQKFPVIFTGAESSANYFESLDQLITLTLGEEVRRLYRIVIDDAPGAAQWIGRKIRKVQGQRRTSGDAYYFNWLLRIPLAWQKPFDVTHENVAALRLRRDMPPHELAFNLKRAFSAIVTGNVKENGIRMIRERGPFILHGDRDIMDVLDKVLGEFVAQGRMKLPGARYECCFQLATD
jgi:predicted Rossmann-fold nucleotide-binding protein